VTQALPCRRFLGWSGVAGHVPDETADQCRAVLISARRAQQELDNLLAAGLISRREHAERRAAFQRDIIDAERLLRTTDSRRDIALPAVLATRKAAIIDAARRGLITDRTASNHIAALDEQILRSNADGEHSPEDTR
jgi:CPA1 family monovalent cation:H+ antiporter